MGNSPAHFTNTHPAHSEERAPFHLREPTTEEYSSEMLYFENGDIAILQVFAMRGRRKHVYRPT
jgi:hypothetical protein